MSDPTATATTPTVLDNDGEPVDRGIDERTHLLIRGTPLGRHIACGKPFNECVYYVSSRRYVDCEACLRAASADDANGGKFSASEAP